MYMSKSGIVRSHDRSIFWILRNSILIPRVTASVCTLTNNEPKSQVSFKYISLMINDVKHIKKINI